MEVLGDLVEDMVVSQMEVFQGDHLEVEVSIQVVVASFPVEEAFLEDQVVVEAYQEVVAYQVHLAREVEAYLDVVERVQMVALYLKLEVHVIQEVQEDHLLEVVEAVQVVVVLRGVEA